MLANKTIVYLPISIVSAIIFTIMIIPSDIHPAFLYLISVAVAIAVTFLFLLLVWGFGKWGNDFSLVPGLLAVFCILTLAIVVLVDGMYSFR